MQNKKKLLLACALLGAGLATTAHAEISLTPVTGGITALETALLAAVGTVITAGIGLRAIKAGGIWLVGLFTRMMGR